MMVFQTQGCTVKYLLFASLLFVCVFAEDYDDVDYEVAKKVIKLCSMNDNKYSCLANKAAVAMERAIKWDIPLFDGFALTRNEEYFQTNLTTEPRSWTNGIERLSTAVGNFLNSHTLTLDLTLDNSERARAGYGGGYGGGKVGKKERKYLHYALMALLGVFGISGPLILKTLSLIAGKALIASKIALIIVGSVALKKIFDKDSGHSTVKVHTHTINDHEDEYDRRIDPGAYKFSQTL